MEFADRQGRLRVLDALELRAKQFRGREDLWPFRVPHEPLDLQRIIDRVMESEGASERSERATAAERGTGAPASDRAGESEGRSPSVDIDALRSRTVLEFLWDAHRWELWVVTLPSGILLYCDSDGDETRVLASAKRGNPGEADGFFLERLAESRGVLFGIEMSGPAPDAVRSSIGDRGFLADVFVELFEGTDAQDTIAGEPAADFHASVERWLERVLTAPPLTRRQKRLEAAIAER
jgi:hypothetical protein